MNFLHVACQNVSLIEAAAVNHLPYQRYELRSTSYSRTKQHSDSFQTLQKNIAIGICYRNFSSQNNNLCTHCMAMKQTEKGMLHIKPLSISNQYSTYWPGDMWGPLPGLRIWILAFGMCVLDFTISKPQGVAIQHFHNLSDCKRWVFRMLQFEP